MCERACSKLQSSTACSSADSIDASMMTSAGLRSWRRSMPREAVSRSRCASASRSRCVRFSRSGFWRTRPEAKAADLLRAQADATCALDFVAQCAQAGSVDAARGGEGVHAFQRRGHRRGHFAAELADQLAKCVVGPKFRRKCGASAAWPEPGCRSDRSMKRALLRSWLACCPPRRHAPAGRRSSRRLPVPFAQGASLGHAAAVQPASAGEVMGLRAWRSGILHVVRALDNRAVDEAKPQVSG